MIDVALEIAVMVEDATWQAKIARLKNPILRAVQATILTQNKLRLKHPHYEINIVLVDDMEIKKLNAQHRGKDYATNVLSFPLERDPPAPGMPVMLGDVVLTHGVIAAEAKAAQKTFTNHVLHLVVHGVLHICGYDHMTNAQARTMERLERDILAGLDLPNPYAVS